MPTETISCGPPVAILQNVVYALPPTAGRLHSLAAVEISPDGVTWDALTNSETTGADVGSGFVRCTTGNTTVIIKRY